MGFIHVTQGIMFKQISVGKNAKFLPKQIAPGHTDTGEIFNRTVQYG
jgi:hypothetical protein